MTYEELDRIADLYVPTLAVAWCGLLLYHLLMRQWWLSGRVAVTGLFAVAVAYGVMFFDNAVRLWPSVGLDYSTHTALALALGLQLVVFAPRFRGFVIASQIAYGALMHYQAYHTWADMFTTAICVLPVMAAPFWWRRLAQARRAAGPDNA